ncbi:hypothetical protein BDV93DRAFT_605682 [Ceratobasidium sp. AG-I]|nr:hypothetical protein BDV93DRAFT_605682 [Ceratobasidium sp. AG-I]
MSAESLPDPQTNNKRHIVDLGAGDIELCVDNTTFRTHKYKLHKFSILSDLIQRAVRLNEPRYVPTISVQLDTGSIEDFKNTFKVLYASVVKGPLTFDAPVLISALRISSTYGYPALRAFSIARLEDGSLSAIQRIELAREFQLASWEGPAYNELYTRGEAITREEARVLGSDALSIVAMVREENLKREKAALRELIAQAKREADEQASRVAHERWVERREAEAMRKTLQRALDEATKVNQEATSANREAISRVRREADEQANRVARDRDRLEAQAIREAVRRAQAPVRQEEGPVVKRPFSFDSPVLISALRISTTYDYPALRAFSITHLERISLSAVQRIELAREFQLKSWEGPAYEELYIREAPMTQEEARILGSDAFSLVARMREENMKREKAAMREAIARVRQETDEQANRIALKRDRREAEAMKEVQRALVIPREEVEKPRDNKAINQLRKEEGKCSSNRRVQRLENGGREGDAVSGLLPSTSIATSLGNYLRTNNLNNGGKPVQQSNEPIQPEPYEIATKAMFSEATDVVDLGAGAGDIELRVNDTIFKSHKYQLDKFSLLNKLIQATGHSEIPRSLPAIRVETDKRGVSDFINMFKILYASVIDGPFAFDPPILISALRISSAYDFSALCTFSIKGLENVNLSAIERIQLAREFQLESWENRVYNELTMRKEAVTKEEARVLGTDAFWEVTRMRAEKRVAEENARKGAEAKPQASVSWGFKPPQKPGL